MEEEEKNSILDILYLEYVLEIYREILKRQKEEPGTSDINKCWDWRQKLAFHHNIFAGL